MGAIPLPSSELPQIKIMPSSSFQIIAPVRTSVHPSSWNAQNCPNLSKCVGSQNWRTFL